MASRGQAASAVAAGSGAGARRSERAAGRARERAREAERALRVRGCGSAGAGAPRARERPRRRTQAPRRERARRAGSGGASRGAPRARRGAGFSPRRRRRCAHQVRPPRHPGRAQQPEERSQAAADLVGGVAGRLDLDVGHVDQPEDHQERRQAGARGHREHEGGWRLGEEGDHGKRDRQRRGKRQHDVDRAERLPRVQVLRPDADHPDVRHPHPAVQPEPRQEHHEQQQKAARTDQELAWAGASRGHPRRL